MFRSPLTRSTLAPGPGAPNPGRRRTCRICVPVDAPVLAVHLLSGDRILWPLSPDSGSAGLDIASGLHAVASASLRGTAAAMLGVSIAAVSVCSFSPAPLPGCGRIGWPKHDNCGALGMLPKTDLVSCWAYACAPIAARERI